LSLLCGTGLPACRTFDRPGGLSHIKITWPHFDRPLASMRTARSGCFFVKLSW
jgi:hypothetical protein